MLIKVAPAIASQWPGHGWLAGLRDLVIGRALALLHDRPANDWTMDALAKGTGVSRSVLADRFARVVGYPPMHYLARWRMQLAARELSDSSKKVASIGRELGYESEATFNRAFKRITGVSPAMWRVNRTSSGV